LGRSSVAAVYGAAGSVVTILLWVYYSALIFFFGAEITQIYAKEYGSGIRPTYLAEQTQNTGRSPS
jgi:membrane protein